MIHAKNLERCQQEGRNYCLKSAIAERLAQAEQGIYPCDTCSCNKEACQDACSAWIAWFTCKWRRHRETFGYGTQNNEVS